jgi:glycosyltransferase involved in cell wall biosynthesis
LIFPSLFEGFGIPLAEAMNAGTTVLCSNLASMPEVCGDCAFYFDPRDPADICRCMEYVDQHPAEVLKKKEEFPTQLKKFDTETCVLAYKQVFEKLAKESAHRR